MTAIALQHRDEIIKRVSSGEELHDIARDLQIKSPNISKHLASDQEYKEARELGVSVRLSKAKKAIEEIADLGVDGETGEIVGITQNQSNLARVRAERLKAEQWFAEREFPEKYAQKQQVNVNVTADVSDRLLRARERVIGGQRPPADRLSVDNTIDSDS